MTTKTPKNAIASLGLTIEAKFLPWSQAKRWERDDGKYIRKRAIYWLVTVKHNGHAVLTTQYAQGIGHLPDHLQVPWNGSVSLLLASAIEQATETGKARRSLDTTFPITRPLKPPSAEDVLYCLLSDSEAIDRPTFEEWASDLGYDPDSRKAETAYRACLATGLALRSAIGDVGLSRLREAFQDY